MSIYFKVDYNNENESEKKELQKFERFLFLFKIVIETSEKYIIKEKIRKNYGTIFEPEKKLMSRDDYKRILKKIKKNNVWGLCEIDLKFLFRQLKKLIKAKYYSYQITTINRVNMLGEMLKEYNQDIMLTYYKESLFKKKNIFIRETNKNLLNLIY